MLAFAAASISWYSGNSGGTRAAAVPVLEPNCGDGQGHGIRRMVAAVRPRKAVLVRAGFAFVFIFWNALPWISPAFPEMPVRGRVYAFFGRDMPPMFSYIDPFLVRVFILSRIWTFCSVCGSSSRFSWLEFGIFNRLGYSIGGQRRPVRVPMTAASSWQGLGAFCVFVLFGPVGWPGAT